MRHEYEAKFLSIDVADLKTRLKDPARLRL